MDSLHKTLPQEVFDEAGITAKAESAMRYMYSGASQKEEDKNVKATLPLPMELGLGIAYKPNANLLFSTDISWTQWSSWDIIEIKLSDGTINEMVQKWEDGIRFGVGLEYTMNSLQFRTGYYTEPSAVPDLSMTPTIPDINRRHAINVGFSYHLGKFALHGSYEHIFIGDYELGVTGWEYDEDAMGYHNMAGEYTMSVNNLMFGVEYSF